MHLQLILQFFRVCSILAGDEIRQVITKGFEVCRSCPARKIKRKTKSNSIFICNISTPSGVFFKQTEILQINILLDFVSLLIFQAGQDLQTSKPFVLSYLISSPARMEHTLKNYRINCRCITLLLLYFHFAGKRTPITSQAS